MLKACVVRHETVQIQLYVGPSHIAGQGLFAAQDIPQGTRIIAYIGEKISVYESVRRCAAGNAYIFHLNYRSAIDGQTFNNTARYINHSCDPNCVVEKTAGTLWSVAMRAIPAGRNSASITGMRSRIIGTIPAPAVPSSVVAISSLSSIGDV
jgi:hypothetical protein